MLGIPFYGYGFSAFIIGIVVFAILWFVLKHKRDNKPLISARIKNTALLCMLMLMVGYSSYALIVIVLQPTLLWIRIHLRTSSL
jgi:O-antigen/teichoic acid export membrane protein